MRKKHLKRVFVFDLGGVVISRGMWLWRDKINKKFGFDEEESLKVFIKKYYQEFFSGKINWGEYITKCFAELGAELSDNQAEELRRLLVSCYKIQVEVVDLLKSLRKQGEVLVLLSDQHPSMFNDLNGKYKISKLFDHIIVSSETRFTKKDMELFELAEKQILQGFGKVGKIIFIDDLEQNLTKPQRIGWETILYTNSSQLKDNLRKYVPHL